MNEPTATHPITVSLDAARASRGSSEFSAAGRRAERESLDQLIEAAEAEHGPVTGEEVRSLREQLAAARAPGRGRPLRSR
ncbi:CopG family transcriptional regulator [Streptomyces sp. NPDC094448]|uniref:CopG family transcriptional regulator n=1 Tax=Streptomyces sp. NPDC094448 TaxID=3366063 RepID=UPI003802434A